MQGIVSHFAQGYKAPIWGDRLALGQANLVGVTSGGCTLRALQQRASFNMRAGAQADTLGHLLRPPVTTAAPEM